MQNESNKNTERFKEEMNKSFSSWNPVFDDELVWQKLSNSIDEEKSFKLLKTEINKNEPVIPEELWTKINTSLDNDFVEEKLKSDFKNWNPIPAKSTFNDIQESIQLEQIWSRLNTSLKNQEKPKKLRFLKATFLTCVLFVSFFTNDFLNINSFEKIYNKKLPIISNVNKVDLNAKSSTYSIIPKTKKGKKSTHQQIILPSKFKENYAENNKENAFINEESNNLITKNEIRDVNNLPFLKFTILNNKEHEIGSLKNLTIKQPKFNFGINYFTSINFIKNNTLKSLTSNSGGFGYEFGLFFGHKIRSLNQEYILNYCVFNQLENTFENGLFTHNKYNFSGFKINTFTSFPLASKFNIGGGLSTFIPTQAVKERANIIVDLPKINAVNFGINLGIDYKFQFFKAEKLIVSLKYESIFSLNNSTTNFKVFQNCNLGLKYKF